MKKDSYTEITGSLSANPKSKVISHESGFIDEITGEQIKKDMEEVGMSGFCAALITGKNQITPYPLGKDLEGNDLDENSVFQAASLSKAVFAYLVLRLIASMEYKDLEGNAFNLDTRLDKIFSAEELEAKFEAGKDETNKIDETYKKRFKSLTPRMLLSHTAGFPIGYNPSKLPSFQFEPDTEFCYSGPGIVLLQGVVEKITDSNLESLAKKYVFKPCGMSTSTTFEWDEQTKQKKPHLNLKPDAANSLRTTASDYAKFAWQWMQDKTVIDAFKPPKDKKKFHKAKDWTIDASWEIDQNHESEHKAKLNNARSHLAWGVGIGLQLDNSGKKATAAFHSGDMDNFRAFVAMDLETRQKAIVYFANSFNGFVLAQQIINPQIPSEHAFHNLGQTFGFALNVAELENNYNKLGLQPSRSERVHYSPDSEFDAEEESEENPSAGMSL